MSEWAPEHCAIVGATGGIGAAFAAHLADRHSVKTVHCLSRSGVAPFEHEKLVAHRLDYEAPETIAAAADTMAENGPLDLVIVATGLLHDGAYGPEKTLRHLEADALMRAFRVNTIGPALVAKALLPKLTRDRKSVFAALSARVGSISDNRIGGWYGYRAAKSALNQMLKTASIEHARRWPESVVIGLHPGTVDTDLSKPFQRNVADGKLFTPEHATSAMLQVIDGLSASDTGKVFAYDGAEIPA